MTTTPFKIDLMLPAMGMKRFTSHSRTPTTIKTTTRLMRGMIYSPSSHADTRPRWLLTGVSMWSENWCENVERNRTWECRGGFRLKRRAWFLASVFLLPPQTPHYEIAKHISVHLRTFSYFVCARVAR